MHMVITHNVAEVSKRTRSKGQDERWRYINQSEGGRHVASSNKLQHVLLAKAQHFIAEKKNKPFQIKCNKE